jgi:hypothetical protein
MSKPVRLAREARAELHEAARRYGEQRPELRVEFLAVILVREPDRCGDVSPTRSSPAPPGPLGEQLERLQLLGDVAGEHRSGVRRAGSGASATTAIARAE